MIRRNLSFTLLTISLTLSLMTSCIEGGNYTSFTSYGVLNYNSEVGGTTLITTTVGEAITPEITTGYTPGDCVFANFTIDYDNQPHSRYYTLTDVLIPTNGRIEQSPLQIEAVDEKDPEYNGVFSYVNPITAYEFRGKLFFEMQYKARPKQSVAYSLMCDPNEKGEDDALTLYLRARITGEETGTVEDIADIYVFDAYNLLHRHGKDSIDANDESYRYKYVSVHLKYCDGIDNEGNYTYKNVYNNATKIIISSSALPFN